VGFYFHKLNRQDAKNAKDIIVKPFPRSLRLCG
jgi:hypothetical protein